MCQKAGLVKRLFLVLAHTQTSQPIIRSILPPLTQYEEIYHMHKKSGGLLNTSELDRLFGVPLVDAQYSMVPLEIPVNWLKRIQDMPPRLR